MPIFLILLRPVSRDLAWLAVFFNLREAVDQVARSGDLHEHADRELSTSARRTLVHANKCG